MTKFGMTLSRSALASFFVCGVMGDVRLVKIAANKK